MTRQFSRRSIVGVIGASVIAAVAPVAGGWRQLLAEALGQDSGGVGAAARNGTSPADVDTPGGTEVPPVEQITFLGAVERPLGPASFVGSNKRFQGVTIDLSVASRIYPTGHVSRAGDDFGSRGRWLGAVGHSVWQAEYVNFNLRRVRGRLDTSATSDPEARYALNVGTKTWSIVFRASETTHFTRAGAVVTPTDSAFAFTDGTAVEIIGYEDRPGVIVATYIEAQQ